MNRIFARLARLAVSAMPIAIAPGASSATPDMPRIVGAEQSAWDIAQEVDTVASYTKYVIDNPAGAHVAEARARIEAIRGNRGLRQNAVVIQEPPEGGKDLHEGVSPFLMNI